MDLDAYIAHHGGQWTRLEDLVGRRRLSGAEADELVDLYQRVSTHLSVLRSEAPDPSVVSHLSTLLARARVATAGRPTTTWADAGRFVTATFPAALYRIRWWWLGTAAASVVVILGVTSWGLAHPELYTSRLSPEEVRAYVGTDFANYYREFPHHDFATLVWVNNAWVCALCIALGILGVPVVYLLWTNILGVGVVAAMMVGNDRTGLFLGLILPHGLLELTAVFVAGGTGLRIFWSWIDPGGRSRGQALVAESLSAAVVAVGLVGVLLVSGAIEGFVTPSGLPTWARVAVGVLAEAAFLAYVFTLGRRAHRRGALAERVRAQTSAAAPTSA